jgi:mono/diheme cytochrome c family protein
MKRLRFPLLGWLVAPMTAWFLATTGPGRVECLAKEKADAKLALQAREILSRHCQSCHGNGPGKVRGPGLRILDHRLLTKGRKVVVPGSPGASLLLDLVEGRSMPPGDRPKVSRQERALLRAWIKAGAPPFPQEFGQEYLLQKIVEDVRRLKPEQKRHVRYLSLHHLHVQNHLPAHIEEQRKALREVLRYLVPPGKKPPKLLACEPTGTLFRIDIHDLGWDAKPFGFSSLTLFDLALLEYPYGVLPTKSPRLAELASSFLLKTQQVRPVPYVHADWLVRAVTQPPLHADFLKALGKPASSTPPRIAVTPADRQLQEGVPIVPVDGLTHPNHRASPGLTVELKFIDFLKRNDKDPPAKKVFLVNKDRMSIWIRANQDVVIERLYVDVQGNMELVDVKAPLELKANEPEVWSGMDDKGFIIMGDFEGKEITEHITVFAYPKSALQATRSDYPKGKVLSGKGVRDRFVHPLYQFTKEGKGLEPPDPGKMVKVTAGFTGRKP